MFLVFEGIDGAGKSTQIQLLAEYLTRERDTKVFLLQEPGGTSLGKRVRSLLLEPRSGDLSAETEVFLFMAARSHLVKTRIRPAIDAGEIVLCDRFLWSSVVYQGIVGGLGVQEVLRLGKLATGGVMPDRTFLLDIPVATVARRKSFQREGDRIERKGLRFQERIRQGFLELARKYPRRFAIIDARGKAEVVHARVVERLPRRRRK